MWGGAVGEEDRLQFEQCVEVGVGGGDANEAGSGGCTLYVACRFRRFSHYLSSQCGLLPGREGAHCMWPAGSAASHCSSSQCGLLPGRLIVT